MAEAADFAFRQALAISPSSPETVFRYVNQLVEEGRTNDALLVAQTASNLAPENGQISALAQQLEQTTTGPR